MIRTKLLCGLLALCCLCLTGGVSAAQTPADPAEPMVGGDQLYLPLIQSGDAPQSGAATTTAPFPPAAAVASKEQMTDQLVIRYRESIQSAAQDQTAQLAQLSQAAGVALTFVRTMSGEQMVLKLPERMTRSAVDEIAARLEQLPEILRVEADAIMRPLLTPNDPRYPEQWHYAAPTAGNYGVNLPTAWDVTTGASSTVVAVIDTGIRTHADLAGRVLAGYDFVSDTTISNDGDGRDADASDPGDSCNGAPSSWHGTHVAGTIAANSNNNLGVAGINWQAKILPVRVLGICYGYTSDIVDGMRWAAGLTVPSAPVNANPAKVLNLSLGGASACSPLYQEAINDIVTAGATVVVAAGNSVDYAEDYEPASCTNVITVGATDRNGNRAYYSNFGATVEISAPGGDIRPGAANGILSTLNSGLTTPAADSYAFYQGTSMATPHVVGIVSLLLAVNPTLTPAQIQTILQTTATVFPAGSTCTTTFCGAGIVNAAGAVAAAVNTNTPAAPTNLQATAVSRTQIDLTWNDAATNELGFTVERCQGAGCTNFALLAVVGANGNRYHDSGVNAGNSYRYRVRATTGGRNSGYSNSAAVNTAALEAAPSFVLKWGTGGSEDGQLRNPAVAVDRTGAVYVADFSNHRVQKFSSSGAFLQKWGTEGAGDGQFSLPVDIAVDGDNNLYVAEYGNSRIQKFASNGLFLAKWGSAGTGAGQFNGIGGVAIDQSGNVYVTDSRQDRVQKFSNSGLYLTEWRFSRPDDGRTPYLMDIAIDANDNIYVADYFNHLVRKFDRNGAFLLQWGTRGVNDGQFRYPIGVEVDSANNIYVADFMQDRIQKFDSNGRFLAKWGVTGVGDGQFFHPWGAAVTLTGDVYVADTWNNRIQKFTYPTWATPTPTATGPTATPTATPTGATATPTVTPTPTPTATMVGINPPSNLQATTVSNSQIQLSWQDNSSNEGVFILERCLGANCSAFQAVVYIGQNTTLYLDRDLTAGTTYCYRVKAQSIAGEQSTPSNSACATTVSLGLAAPSGLVATAVSHNRINLTWTDNATAERGFRIERCQGSDCTSFALIFTTGANSRSYNNTGLPSNTTYCYRVVAFNGSNTSPYSNTVCSTTGLMPPTSLTATRILATEVNLHWVETVTNETGFKLQRCIGATCTDFTQLVLLPPNVVGYHDTGLSANTTYRYRIAAYNLNGDSAYSTIRNVTTAASTVTAQDEPLTAAEAGLTELLSLALQPQAQLPLTQQIICSGATQANSVELVVGETHIPMVQSLTQPDLYQVILLIDERFAVGRTYSLTFRWHCLEETSPTEVHLGLLQVVDAQSQALPQRSYLPVVVNAAGRNETE